MGKIAAYECDKCHQIITGEGVVLEGSLRPLPEGTRTASIREGAYHGQCLARMVCREIREDYERANARTDR